jgi:hypothetical protein
MRFLTMDGMTILTMKKRKHLMNSEHDTNDDAPSTHEAPPHFLGSEMPDHPAAGVYTGCVPENPPYTSAGIGEGKEDTTDGTNDAVTSPEKPLTEAERHLSVLEEQVRMAGRDGDIPPQLLHMAAVAWERWHQAAEMLAREGITVQTSQGVGAHPAAMIERQACQTYQNLISRMGLSATPSQARYKANKTPRLKKALTISDLMSRQAEEIPAS